MAGTEARRHQAMVEAGVPPAIHKSHVTMRIGVDRALLDKPAVALNQEFLVSQGQFEEDKEFGHRYRPHTVRAVHDRRASPSVDSPDPSLTATHNALPNSGMGCSVVVISTAVTVPMTAVAMLP